MNYVYRIEQIASKMCVVPGEFTILCYSINTDCIEPFLLFMVEKQNDQKLNFPKIKIKMQVDSVEDDNCDHRYVETRLMEYFNCDINYLGMVCDISDNYYAVVKMEHDMLKDTNTNNIFYALATEIINNKKLYNYLFSEEIINLFLNTPTFYMLINKNKNIHIKCQMLHINQ